MPSSLGVGDSLSRSTTRGGHEGCEKTHSEMNEEKNDPELGTPEKEIDLVTREIGSPSVVESSLYDSPTCSSSREISSSKCRTRLFATSQYKRFTDRL